MKKLKRWARDARRKLVGKDVRSERALGDARRNVGDWTMAAHHYRAHLKRHPREFGIWVQLGHALKEAGRYDDADAAYREADKLDPANADLLLCRGHLAKLRGSLETAADFYSRSFALDANPDAARELGQLSTRPVAPRPTTLTGLAGALDGFGDGTLVGWAVDPQNPGAAAEVEVLVDGELEARGLADVARDDLVEAGFATHAAGFAIDLSGRIDLSDRPSISARVAGSGVELAGAPLIATVSPEARRWAGRWADASDAAVTSIRSRLGAPAGSGSIAFIVPLQAEAPYLADLIASLDAQWCDRWSALLAPAADATPKLSRALQKRLAADPRLRMLEPGSSLQSAVSAGQADLFCIIPAGSILEPQAVWRILDAGSGDTELIYWDEARIGAKADAVERFVVRPCLNPQDVEAAPDLLGTVAVSRSLAATLLSQTANADVSDFGALALARARQAAHIPAVLERRRVSFRAVADVAQEGEVDLPSRRVLIVLGPDLAHTDTRDVVEAILTATPRSQADLLVVCRGTRSNPLDRFLRRLSDTVGVFTCEDDEPAAEAINRAVAVHAGAQDDLILATRPVFPQEGWLSALTRKLRRDEVGAAAPILVTSRGSIVSAGVAPTSVGLRRRYAGVPLRQGRRRTRGWNAGLVSSRRDAAAETCVAVRAERFRDVGGLDPLISEPALLADLCLRLGRRDLEIVVDAEAPVTVPEEAPPPADPLFVSRWRELAQETDRFWHPAVSDAGALMSPDETFAPPRRYSVRGGSAAPPSLADQDDATTAKTGAA
ncbi:MAG: hypothetical protein ACK4Z5_01250 [Brevundimonas sp.]